MKLSYLFILIFLMLVMVYCMVYTVKRESKYTRSIVHLMAAAICGSLFYCGFLLSKTLRTAMLADSLYFLTCDFLSLFMMDFIEEYANVQNKFIIKKKILRILIAVDCVALLINNRTEWMFSLVTKSRGTYTYFTENFLPTHYLHLGLCYLMLSYCLVLLLYKGITVAQIYKAKYFVILIPFLILIIVNAFCYSQGFPVDISVGIYGVLSAIICFCIFKAVPKGIVAKAHGFVTENIKKGLLCFDIMGNCIYVNKCVKETVDAADPKYMQQVETYFREKHKQFSEQNKDTESWEEEIWEKEEKKTFSFYYQELLDNKGKFLGYFFITEDHTEEIRVRAEQLYKATHDVLTGLLNRESFFREVDRFIAKNPKGARWMIASDIKDFKLINNIYGEEYGNTILKMQAELVKQSLKEDTICGRIAGDKFAMFINRDNFDIEVFQKSVYELQKYTMEKKYRITYHIGYYNISDLVLPAQMLYNRVTMAIATIHDNYEQIFVEYDKKIVTLLVNEKNMLTEFEGALENNQFQMYLQPQISKEGIAIGAEALVRWQHPERGLVYPGDFIEAFEKAGVIFKLDLYIWEQAARKLREWKEQGLEQMHISINISAKDFYYLDIYEELTKIIEKYDILPRLLKLEITESAVMIDQQNDFATLVKLRDYGFEIEIDDFGSGYSSLNMLKELNVDVLKIDRMFLKETEDKKKNKIILSSVISLAKQLGMQVVTEGVEDLAQVDSLKAMGCDVFQGYYFDKPITVSQFEEKYLHQNMLK